jgi:hypothetical protein
MVDGLGPQSCLFAKISTSNKDQSAVQEVRRLQKATDVQKKERLRGSWVRCIFSRRLFFWWVKFRLYSGR